jgi:hypothetical protein
VAGRDQEERSMNRFLQFLDSRSRDVLLVLTLCFLGLETFYALHRPLSIDEFKGARSVVETVTRVPYVDFTPYKPVPGYYLQYLFLQLGSDPWNGFLTVRLGMTLLAVGTLALGALWLRRLYRPAAVCLAYGLLVVMTSLVEWLIEFRLDMLTGLFGFVSLLCLLERRPALAGWLAGFSFLISQKGAIYGVAGGVALLGCLLVQRDWRWARDALCYSVCVALPIALYVAGWSLVAPFRSVVDATFFQATQLHALANSMPGKYNHYTLMWLLTLIRNPLFYFCAAWALVCLLLRGRGQTPRESLLFFYAVTVTGMLLSVRQPWWYMFVLLVPTAFVLLADLFSRKLDTDPVFTRPVALACYLVLGVFLPLTRVPVVARDDLGYQRQTVELAHALLQPGDRYFAGLPILYRSAAHETAVGSIDPYSANPIDQRSAAQHTALVERFRVEPIRFVVYTPVIDSATPEVIRKHVQRNYAPLWSNIWIYAPQFPAGDSQVNLLFAGSYTLETERPADSPVQIDGKTCPEGGTLSLERGRHTIASPVRVRLKLQPSGIDHLLNPAYREPSQLFWTERLGPGEPCFSTGVWLSSKDEG